MEGVTTAIVLFVFVCVLFPRLIDSRPQYYAAFVLTLLIVLLTPIAFVLGGDARAIAGIVLGALQVAAIVLLFLSAGGLTVRGLTREMLGAFEVIRRGETSKEVIIPIGNEQKEKRRKSAVESRGEPVERFDLSAEAQAGAGYPPRKPTAPPPPPPPSKKSDEDDDGPIPMD